MAALKHGIRNSETEMEKEMETETETATETESVKEGSKQWLEESILMKRLFIPLLAMNANSQQSEQGAEKIIFTACHSDKLKPAFTSAAVILTSPKKELTSSIDFTFPLSFDRGKLKT